MEVESDLCDEVKVETGNDEGKEQELPKSAPDARNGDNKEEEEEVSKVKVGENDVGKRVDVGSVEGLDLSGKKLFSNVGAGVHLWTNTIPTATRPMTMPTSGLNATVLAPAQLTIFYGGSVNVFDAIPAEKAHEIMLLAAAAAVANSGDMKNIGNDYPATSPVLTRSPSLQSMATALASPRAQLYPIQRNSLCKLQAELPIARKHSLQRFFEKRRDRLVSKTPYPTSIAKTNLSTEASPDAGCFGKPNMPQEEFQPNVVAHLA